ncbi:MAG: transketolase [Ignavibacteriae bacterium]|nr:MAG: transketolase [Ignavibacteriota bacterium]
MQKKVEELSINTIRLLSVDAIQKANSGHPGMPMGCAPIAYLLYKKIMKHNPENPNWINRDRFVLSGGHGSMLLYSSLYLSGYNISLDDIKNFRQWESITPGHPESNKTPGVETTTGPLGQGIANAVGMALAQRYLAALFNKDDFELIDHYIFVEAGDGDLMEGISHEAASFAGHQKLDKLILIYDDNNITIDGKTSLAYSDDVEKRFKAYNWHVEKVNDVNNLNSLEAAITKAKDVSDRPSIIITKTIIGNGSPNKQNTSSVHGSPLGEEEVKLTKRNLEFPEDKFFYVPNEVIEHFAEVKENGKKLENEWKELFEEYKNKYPNEAKLFCDLLNGNLGTEWEKKIPKFQDYKTSMATRKASGIVLNEIASELPGLIGGSADLSPSNNTILKEFQDLTKENPTGRYIRYGIREHAMAAIMNGIAIYGGIIPYAGTFLVFSDYLRPSLRLASLSKVKTIFVFTHDSIGVGEDGPTHQPIEHFSVLRAIPGVILLRPSDANETAEAWRFAIKHHGSPVTLALTRQNLPTIDRNKYGAAEGLKKGAYILKDSKEPEIILMATGSEVYLVLDAAEKLEASGISVRVVSFPSWEIFEMQNNEYKNSVLPKKIKKRISVEAGIGQGWEKYVGDEGKIISIEHYGASAPQNILFEKFGFTVERIIEETKLLLTK